MKYLILLLTVCSLTYSYAADAPYATSSIPATLLKSADVVKRMEEIRFEIISSKETVLHKKFALTILNENGDERAGFIDYYDKLKQIKSIEGTLYDANGKQVKTLKSKDILDRSGVDNNNLMDDNRLKIHNFFCKTYPYTVEYEVEIKYNNSYMLPQWMPQDYEHLSVEASKFEVVVPNEYVLRYNIFNYKGEPVSITEKGKKVTTWQVTALPAITRQYASPRWNELTTSLYLAPSEFEMEGYKGNGNTWKELGKFQIALNEGRDQLPDNVLQAVKNLTAGIKEEKEKVKVLYRYLQQNTRYISIQLGIGGLQPFPADFVAKKGYGDCKALSNYMYSLLKAAGIKSYYAWVHAGEGMDDQYLMEGFPSDQFNHIIVCVPLQKDTMWLECTNQSLPAGYMGTFTGNRKALLITENGGELVATPKYGLKENLQIRSIKGSINDEGTLDVKTITKYMGEQQDDLHGMLTELSKDKVKKILNEELNLSTYDINDFKYEQRKDMLPEIDEQLDISVSNYAAITGKRLFIAPNMLNRSNRTLNEEERLYDMAFGFAYTDIDSVEIEMPKGYEPEALPKDVTLKNKFGTYQTITKVSDNKLFYYRKREQFAGTFPAKGYEELVSFYSDMFKADRSKVVLVKKE